MTQANNDEKCVPCKAQRDKLKQSIKERNYVQAVKDTAQGVSMLIGQIVTYGGIQYRFNDHGEMEKLDE